MNGKTSPEQRQKFINAIIAADVSYAANNRLHIKFIEHMADCLMASDLSSPPSPDDMDFEVLKLIRVWRECHAEKRPSAAALAERIIAVVSSTDARYTPS
ncbi:hypothetical protein LMTR13_11275 [Bradyrhizobium icense]|uniref:Uncharacterized protein n=2 Tax=Bradyrhizobium icense TaxID=1274631 RepID=A0A1B1UD07_9BRAD|nr:hypothetical protein LMTR13_11275 [Bradyrhizobium icense]